MEKKLIPVGNGWALYMNATILQLLDIDPETDMVNYQVENDVLKITKTKKKK